MRFADPSAQDQDELYHLDSGVVEEAKKHALEDAEALGDDPVVDTKDAVSHSDEKAVGNGAEHVEST